MKILIVCYKIEGGKGSEDGSGYNIVKRLIDLGFDVTVVSRVNNVNLLKLDPNFGKASLIGVDVPKYLGFYKKGGRGIILYYYIWQVLVGMKVRALQITNNYDVVHQLNFHTDWAPHFLSNPNGRLVWGPMSHHKKVPDDFLINNKIMAALGERIKISVKKLFWNFDPFLKSAINRTDLILYADRDMAPCFKKNEKKVKFQTYASTIPALKIAPRRNNTFDVLIVGRLVSLKGFDAAMDAYVKFMAQYPKIKSTFTVIGSGPLVEHLKAKAVMCGILDNTRFVNWVDQVKLRKHYEEASVFLYPSFEAQGLVVAEAMGASLPVVCLSDTGPSFIAERSGLVVERTAPYGTIVNKLAESLGIVYEEYIEDAVHGKYMQRCKAARDEYDNKLDWDIVAKNFASDYYLTGAQG